LGELALSNFAPINVAVNIDTFNLANLLPGVITSATDTKIHIDMASGSWAELGGSFVYGANGLISGGTLTSYSQNFPTAAGGAFTITGFSVPAVNAQLWLAAGDTASALNALMSGADHIQGMPLGNNLIRGFAGDDTMSGGLASDTMFGGLGNDTIVVGASRNPTYLRGDEGNDSISGGVGFDDINGNMGNDTARGYNGDDWVVGGKDNDLLFGDNGFDIVYGNMGDDTVSGDAGADWVRGGQGNDSVSGGDGDDWLWGDRGDDTISGGAGADIFHSFSGTGIDRVTDFNLAEGDRVQLDPGTTYTLKQVGADTVVDMGGGDQVILVGVQLSTLTGSWIFVA
jgi:Ca2+-binding RTX toxin-like protein